MDYRQWYKTTLKKFQVEESISCIFCSSFENTNIALFLEHLRKHHSTEKLAQQLINHNLSRICNFLLDGKQRQDFLTRCSSLLKSSKSLQQISTCIVCKFTESNLFLYFRHLIKAHKNCQNWEYLGEIKMWQSYFQEFYQIDNIYQFSDNYFQNKFHKQSYRRTLDFYFQKPQSTIQQMLNKLLLEWENIIEKDNLNKTIRLEDSEDEEPVIIFEKILP